MRPERDLLDVLDRVLDKGIVIYGHGDMSLGGIQLLSVEARVVVVSIDTYTKYPERATIPPSGVPLPTGDRRSDAQDDEASDLLLSEAVTRAGEEYPRQVRPEGRPED